MQGDAVVRPDRLRLQTVGLAQLRSDRHRPRCVHATPERRQDADAPVTDLVAEALDHDRAIGRDGAGRILLLAQERQQVPRGALVEVVVGAETLRRRSFGQRRELARRGADLLAELERPPDALALPERHGTGHARRGRDQDAVAGDLLDPPRRRAEQERLPRARLVHHLLVELTDAPAAVHEEDAEQTAVGDRPCVRDGQTTRAVTRPDRAPGPVPHDAWTQLGELVRRITAGEHVQDVFELGPRELTERIRPRDERVQLVDGDLGIDRDRDDLLGEHVERIRGDAGLLDLALAHRARHDRALEQIGAELREDAPLRHLAQLVPGATDALETARDGLRRLDLDDEVDRSHVDAELEARGGDQTWDAPGLEILLDEHPLLARERAVMRARELAFGELVEPERKPLGEPAIVDEHDRRAVLLDEAQDLGIDRRPDRLDAPLRAGVHLLSVRRRGVREQAGRSQLAQVLDRDHDLEVELLARPRVDELDRTSARHETADLLERPLRRREAEPLHRGVEQRLEPLDADRKMRPTLRACDRMHLVEDERLDPTQGLACLRREHQVQRLRRGDQDVGRLGDELPALLRRRVTRANGHPNARVEPGKRTAEVAFDVVVERLERRDVQHAKTLSGRRGETVDRVQEGRQRLAGPGRRLDQHVRARRDRGPAELLGGRRRSERALEPRPRHRREDAQRIHTDPH